MVDASPSPDSGSLEHDFGLVKLLCSGSLAPNRTGTSALAAVTQCTSGKRIGTVLKVRPSLGVEFNTPWNQ
jgi:hypothetical protein